MRRLPYFAATLAVVYFLLAFNAYACLLPLYSGVEVAQGSDCAMPKEPPVRDACDAFKTIGVQSLSSVQPLPAFIGHVAFDQIVSAPLLASVPTRQYDRSGKPPFLERDPLALTSLLRI